MGFLEGFVEIFQKPAHKKRAYEGPSELCDYCEASYAKWEIDILTSDGSYTGEGLACSSCALQIQNGEDPITDD